VRRSAAISGVRFGQYALGLWLAAPAAMLVDAQPAEAQPAYETQRNVSRYQQLRQQREAGRRSLQQVEAAGFRYAGGGGVGAFVYFIYRRADGAEYHCKQVYMSVGDCYPSTPPHLRPIPRHVSIPFLKNAGFEYGGISYASGKPEHIYRQPQGGTVYLCPNEGYASCRVSSAGRPQAGARAGLN